MHDALLRRTILNPSVDRDEDDVVPDPLCGCGTAVSVAERLKRRCLGIDVTHLAINLIKRRIKDGFGYQPPVIGEPVSLPDAQALAELTVSVSMVGARPC